MQVNGINPSFVCSELLGGGADEQLSKSNRKDTD